VSLTNWTLFNYFTDRNYIKCAIPFQAIIKVDAHFRTRLPLMFVYTTERYMEWISKQLNVTAEELTGSCMGKDFFIVRHLTFACLK